MIDIVPPSDSLLPYAAWTEAALRAVVRDALEHAGRDGLPGEHHFYITFRTDHPDVSVPGHLRARYPQEMTIVLQHRFWGLKVDRSGDWFSVGLSFGGVPATLVVPFAALTAFADPQVRFGLRFQGATAASAAAVAAPAAEAPAAPTPAADATEAAERPQVVSLAAFRRKPKE